MVDPVDENLRLLGQAKNNLGRVDLPTLSFQIDGKCVGETDEGPCGLPSWCGRARPAAPSADTIEAAAAYSGGRTATSEAADCLLDYLTSVGGTQDCAVGNREGQRAGHSRNALHGAKKRLGIPAPRRGLLDGRTGHCRFMGSATNLGPTGSTGPPDTGDQPLRPVDPGPRHPWVSDIGPGACRGTERAFRKIPTAARR